MGSLKQRVKPVNNQKPTNGGTLPKPTKNSNGNLIPTKRVKPAPVGVSWRLITGSAIMYTVLVGLLLNAFIHVPLPVPADGPLELFSEGRALQTTAHLADVIGHRQVSTPGEEKAAVYLIDQSKKLAKLASKTRPDLEVTVARERVAGAISSQNIFHFDIANVYNNLTNIVLKIAPKAAANKPAVLVNAHYDSTIGTTGASDCAACVAVGLEMARTIIANSSLHLAAPVVFLFNGGEETLMQASHGFMQTSEFASQLGAFINIESTGPWGPDVVFQHSGDWTLTAYAHSAPYPRGNTLAQDFFDLKVIPADTDYRMFSYRQYGTLPGIDVATVFDGTAYHTIRDETSRIRAGTLQALGENMLAATLQFAKILSGEISPSIDKESPRGQVYFDVLAKTMVVYSHTAAAVLHSLPLSALLALSLASGAYKVIRPSRPGKLARLCAPVPEPIDMLRGLRTASTMLVSSLVVPVFIGVARAYVSGLPMAWHGNIVGMYSMFIPAAVAGVLLPHCLPAPSALQQTQEDTLRQDAFGSAFLFALISFALTAMGMHSGFMACAWAFAGLFAGLILFNDTSNIVSTGKKSTSSTINRSKGVSQWGWKKVLIVVSCFWGPILVTLASAVTMPIHIVEKIGMAGSTPGPIGGAVPDIVLGVVIGAAVSWTLGSFAPYFVAALGSKSNVRRFVLVLVALAAAGGAWSSITGSPVPYSRAHPKRLLLQHFHTHTPSGKITGSYFAFAAVDPIPVETVIPAYLNANTNTTTSKNIMSQKDLESRVDGIPFWRSFFPLDAMAQGAIRPGPAPSSFTKTPKLRRVHQPTMNSGLDDQLFSEQQPLVSSTEAKEEEQIKEQEQAQQEAAVVSSITPGCKRLYLQLDTVKAGWAVLNLTGPITAWSLGPHVASTYNSETGGLSHMIRYASSIHTTSWTFWVDVPFEAVLRAQVFVKHLTLTPVLEELLSEFPDWVSPMPTTTWFSEWEFSAAEEEPGVVAAASAAVNTALGSMAERVVDGVHKWGEVLKQGVAKIAAVNGV